MEDKIKIPTEVYSRISGYFRPVNQWNKGKKSEFEDRRYTDMERLKNELNVTETA